VNVSRALFEIPIQRLIGEISDRIHNLELGLSPIIARRWISYLRSARVVRRAESFRRKNPLAASASKCAQESGLMMAVEGIWM